MLLKLLSSLVKTTNFSPSGIRILSLLTNATNINDHSIWKLATLATLSREESGNETWLGEKMKRNTISQKVIFFGGGPTAELRNFKSLCIQISKFSFCHQFLHKVFPGMNFATRSATSFSPCKSLANLEREFWIKYLWKREQSLSSGLLLLSARRFGFLKKREIRLFRAAMTFSWH